MSDTRKTVIITGATGGIGRALARAFAEARYNVVLSGTDAGKLRPLRAALGAPDTAAVVEADISRADGRKRIVDETVARFGRIDVLINNAGIFAPRAFLDVDEADLNRFLDVNVKGTYFLTRR